MTSSNAHFASTIAFVKALLKNQPERNKEKRQNKMQNEEVKKRQRQTSAMSAK